ncbi:hypothetical protein PS833_00950 [Pseudomonas fluorescens]|uniref:Uncharacterized protein n=1 Tax=Pseudomonas fluorescens TaxID=294 RepID=A0A5E7AQG8_PSEFL|nr:hypothetical protein PS833_00950 [Pseudomonas fluorescens]
MNDGVSGGVIAVRLGIEGLRKTCRSWLASEGGVSVDIFITERTPSLASQLLQGAAVNTLQEISRIQARLLLTTSNTSLDN